MIKFLLVGGLVAAGFDPSGEYLLTVSHSGRGVFSTKTWTRVAREYDLAYPKNGHATGIGPIEGQDIAVTELNYQTGKLQIRTDDGKFVLSYECGIVAVDF
jgi:hypothetical protein